MVSHFWTIGGFAVSIFLIMLAPAVGFKVDEIGCSTLIGAAALAGASAFGWVTGAAWTDLTTATGVVIFKSVLTTGDATGLAASAGLVTGASTGLATATGAGAA